MTVVVGTAGHIDHGKTALLRALTGIDADRLPEERRRGMTIDLGYTHLGLPDGTELDFVDVPGHDRLVGNMLVGAGEIDAVMLVVAADDGPRAQTLEHLELLDALALRHGLAVITKADLVEATRIEEVRREVDHALVGTTLAGAPVLTVSSVDGHGIDALLAALVELRDRVAAEWIESASPNPSRMAIDRVFTVKGRGLVVTGTLRGGPLARNATLRLVPGGAFGRARELHVHGRAVPEARAGRIAINIAGVDADDLRRGIQVTDDPGVVATERLLVRLGREVPDRTRVRLHLGTVSTDGAVGRADRDAIDLPAGAVAATLRLAAPIAAAPGDRFLLRRASRSDRAIGGTVLDVTPPRGISRRRQTPDRVRRLADAVRPAPATLVTSVGRGAADGMTARLDLHGALPAHHGRVLLADDVAASVLNEVLETLAANLFGSEPQLATLVAVRAQAARALRRAVSLRRDEADLAATALIDRLVVDGRLERDGERVRLPGAAPSSPAIPDAALTLAMDRLVIALEASMPPPLSEAARVAACPPDGIGELERTGRIVVLDVDLAYAASTYRALEAQALELARSAPLTPAILRDATGTSRKYVMAILADLDRRAVLRRTDAGHVPGPRAPSMPVPSGAAVGNG